MTQMQQAAFWLETYGEHKNVCDFSNVSAWEPGRGYLVRGVLKVGLVCTCGYTDALERLRKWADNPEEKA